MLDAKAAAKIDENPFKQDFPLLAGTPSWPSLTAPPPLSAPRAC